MVVGMEGRYLVRYQFYVVPPYWVVHPLVAFPGIRLDTFVSFSRETPGIQQEHYQALLFPFP